MREGGGGDAGLGWGWVRVHASMGEDSLAVSSTIQVQTPKWALGSQNHPGLEYIKNLLEASSPAAQYHTPPPRRHEVGRWVAELGLDKGRRPRPETGVT